MWCQREQLDNAETMPLLCRTLFSPFFLCHFLSPFCCIVYVHTVTLRQDFYFSVQHPLSLVGYSEFALALMPFFLLKVAQICLPSTS